MLRALPASIADLLVFSEPVRLVPAWISVCCAIRDQNVITRFVRNCVPDRHFRDVRTHGLCQSLGPSGKTVEDALYSRGADGIACARSVERARKVAQ